MEPNTPQHNPSLEDTWRVRQGYWRRKLGRLRLGVEPLEIQLAKYRRVTWMLTAVPLGLASFFVALFTAFRRPDVGLVLAGVLLLPVIAIAWLDYALLASRTARYQRELREYENRQPAPGRT